MGKFIDIEMALVNAADEVMALQDKVEAGEASESDYDKALLPFRNAFAAAEEKRDSFAEMVKSCEANAKLQRDFAASKTKKAKAYENLAQRLKDLARFTMQATGSVELTGRHWKFRLAKNSKDTLTIKKQESLPPECFTTRIETDVDTEKVRELIEAGVIKPDVAMLERGEHLRLT